MFVLLETEGIYIQKVLFLCSRISLCYPETGTQSKLRCSIVVFYHLCHWCQQNDTFCFFIQITCTEECSALIDDICHHHRLDIHIMRGKFFPFSAEVATQTTNTQFPWAFTGNERMVRRKHERKENDSISSY